MTEYGWIIERPGPVYLGIEAFGKISQPALVWTANAMNAIRFARQVDAANAAPYLVKSLEDVKFVEHGWEGK